METAEKAKEKVENMMADSAGVNEEIKAKAEKTARDAEKQADKMSRKAAKAAAKVETAAREEETAGVLPEEAKKKNTNDR